MKFELLGSNASARRGRLHLAHGAVDTPAFMPVGTYGAVKAVDPEEVAALGAQIVLGNTFHLWLRPGLEVVAKFGGLHRFIGRTRAAFRCSAWAPCVKFQKRACVSPRRSMVIA
jgi:queuine tRNA-ribosyltransferase